MQSFTDFYLDYDGPKKGCSGDNKRFEEYDVYEWCSGFFHIVWKW